MLHICCDLHDEFYGGIHGVVNYSINLLTLTSANVKEYLKV